MIITIHPVDYIRGCFDGTIIRKNQKFAFELYLIFNNFLQSINIRGNNLVKLSLNIYS